LKRIAKELQAEADAQRLPEDNARRLAADVELQEETDSSFLKLRDCLIKRDK